MEKKLRRHVLAVMVCAMASGRTQAFERWDSCCGAVCLKAASTLLGQEVELAEMRRWLQPSDHGGISLLEISRGAEKLGFYTAGLRIRHDKMEECTVPMIAHRPPAHFIVLVGLGGGKGVGVIDPPRPYRKFSAEELGEQEYWNVVIVSRQRVDVRNAGMDKPPGDKRHSHTRADAQNPHGLRFDSPVWRLGEIRCGEIKTHVYRFTNANRHKVTFTKVAGVCPCMKIERYPETVEAGGEGEIQVELNSAGLMGDINKSILCVLENGQPQKSVQVRLTVVGRVSRDGELLVTPPTVGLSHVLRGKSYTEQLRIRRIGSEPLSFQECSCSCASVEVKAVDMLGPSEARITIAYHSDDNAPLGPFEHSMRIETLHPAYPSRDVIISGYVVPDIKVDRAEVFLGLLDPAERLHQTVYVEHLRQKAFEVTACHSDSRFINACSVPTDESRNRWAVTLSNKEPLPTGLIEGDVLIETSVRGVPAPKVHCVGLVASGKLPR